MLKPLPDKASFTASEQSEPRGESSYERMLRECLRGELRIVNAGLPESQKRLADLLTEGYPHVVCNDGSTRFFKKTELEYLASILDADEQKALLLPMLVEVGANQAEANILVLSGHEGKVEKKVISEALNMPVACEGGRIRIYRPQLALLRRKFKTTTVYVFSPRIVV